MRKAGFPSIVERPSEGYTGSVDLTQDSAETVRMRVGHRSYFKQAGSFMAARRGRNASWLRRAFAEGGEPAASAARRGFITRRACTVRSRGYARRRAGGRDAGQRNPSLTPRRRPSPSRWRRRFVRATSRRLTPPLITTRCWTALCKGSILTRISGGTLSAAPCRA